jgi:hypothetical protein
MKIGVIKSVQSESLVADECKVCHKVTEQKVQVLQEVFVLGLPLFPSGKTGKAVCTKCKNEVPLYQMPAYALKKYQEVLPTVKTPVWAYTFAIVMGILIAVVIVKAPGEQKKMDQLVDTAKVGDVYEIRYEDESRIFNKTRYTIWKVVDVSNDQISFVESPYDVGKLRDLSDLKSKDEIEKWGADTIIHNRTWLKKQAGIFADGKKIEEIDRK